jgi:hypothetical protein
MTIRRVALIFDDQARPETTGTYCRTALGQFVTVEHFRPGDLERIPRQGFDLYLPGFPRAPNSPNTLGMVAVCIGVGTC